MSQASVKEGGYVLGYGRPEPFEDWPGDLGGSRRRIRQGGPEVLFKFVRHEWVNIPFRQGWRVDRLGGGEVRYRLNKEA